MCGKETDGAGADYTLGDRITADKRTDTINDPTLHRAVHMTRSEQEFVIGLMLDRRADLIKRHNWRPSTYTAQDIHNIAHHLDYDHNCDKFMGDSSDVR